jgi:hypothetical protein
MTYVKVQHSADVATNRKTRSHQHHDDHLKMNIVVAPDGYFLSAGVSSYAADQTAKDDMGLADTFINGGLGQAVVMIHAEACDRGDIQPNERLQVMVDKGYLRRADGKGPRAVPPEYKDLVTTVSPERVKPGDPRLKHDPANTSRLVTRFRNVVECANKRIKEFKRFRNQQPNILILRMHQFLEVACALQNRWRNPLRNKV